MQDIYNRVAIWNSQRYEREFNKELALSLLREEHKEWLESTDEVNTIKELCDISFVAFGIIWKLNASDEELMHTADHSCDMVNNLVALNELWPGYFISGILDMLEYGEEDYPVLAAAHHIINFCMAELFGIGFDFEDYKKAMLILCDSNDSKSIKKVASDVKANANDKGPYYKPAESRLAQLLENVNERIKNS